MDNEYHLSPTPFPNDLLPHLAIWRSSSSASRLRVDFELRVAKVDELMALYNTLKARIQQAQATEVNLADAIVEQSVA